MFGELWIDDPERIASRSVPPAIKRSFDEFVAFGYTIFHGIVDAAAIDAVNADLDAMADHPERFVLKNQGKYIDPAGHGNLGLADRIVDLYAISAAARRAIYPGVVADFLQFIFAEPALAMQSISFTYGSQQAMHQDTAYVISEKPLSLAASWLALEDVSEGTGELAYYPGSHRFEHFLFGGEHKNWMPGRDGQQAHQAFLKQLHAQAAKRGLKEERFHAKKGDVLVWHADLAHGGAKITRPGLTRRSLVTHYCPLSVKPAYRKHVPATYHEYALKNGCYFSSRHYDLRDLEKGIEHAAVIYDGGVTKKRKASGSMA